jgi:uncharacterized 2Fe-2S/4Fe-4S cluster protein (DUF4445 family)
VIVKAGEVEQRSNQHFSAVEVENGYALACQDTIKGNVTIYVPPQKIERKLRTDKTAVQVEAPVGYDARREQPLRRPLCRR